MLVFAIVLVAVLTLVMVCVLGMRAFEEYDSGHRVAGMVAGGLAIVILAAAIAVAVHFTGNRIPPDGCYQIVHRTSVQPVVVGKVASVQTVDDVQFYPITCNG